MDEQIKDKTKAKTLLRISPRQLPNQDLKRTINCLLQFRSNLLSY